MKLYLHIHHLDPGKEEVLVNSLLTADGIIPRFFQEGKTADGNSIAIYIGDFTEPNITTKIKEILNMLSVKTLTTIEEMFLSVSLRLHVAGGMFAFFSPEILQIASSKGIDIYVFNQQNV